MFDGVLLVDKESGWSSFDIVAKVRSILRTEIRRQQLEIGIDSTRVSHEDGVQGKGEQRTETYKRYVEGVAESLTKQSASSVAGVPGFARQQSNTMRKLRVGHCGTLDPLATGLMIIVVGSYTKRASEFSKLDKVYEAQMKLGETSTTGDEEGAKTKVKSKKFKESEILGVMKGFLGKSEQTPPIYSAKKIAGKRAYKLAREGKKVELKPQEITIYDIKLDKYDFPRIDFTVKVSSGTYIRTLVENIAKALGTGAYMTSLRRTKVGDFSLDDAKNIQDVSSQDLITI